MSPALFLTTAIDPALALLPPHMDSKEARVQLLATALQETNLENRTQLAGPALSFYQLEKDQAVKEVFTNNNSIELLRAVCTTLVVPFTLPGLCLAIVNNDILASAIARLNYWLSPLPMPPLGDIDTALSFYAEVWRPAWFLRGQLEPPRWRSAYASALRVVNAS